MGADFRPLFETVCHTMWNQVDDLLTRIRQIYAVPVTGRDVPFEQWVPISTCGAKPRPAVVQHPDVPGCFGQSSRV